MYRMPEKQSGRRTVLNCTWSCFYQYPNHLPNHVLSIELKYPDFFYHFSICFILFYIILWKLISFMQIYAFKRKKTSRKRCVYNHGNSYLFRFTYTKMQITVHPGCSSTRFRWRQNRRLWIPRCLPFWAPFLFWLSRFYKLSFRLFIPTFWCRKVMRNAATD